MLPPAVQDFLDLSSDPDLDDLDGYQADISINTNASNDTRSSSPVMTLSDDLLCNPACWSSSEALRVRARLVSLMDLPPVTHVATSTPTAPKNEPSSVTEPESEPEAPSALPKPPPPPKNETSSVTEPESDDEDLPQPSIKTSIKNLPKNDPSSVTEPESDIEDLPIKTPIKKKSFFDTPSPPGPDSCYWKYVS